MSLRGKNIVVTGATSGIGAEFASLLSAHGANLFIGGRRADKGAQVAEKTKSTFHTIDVADEKFAKQIESIMVQFLIHKFLLILLSKAITDLYNGFCPIQNILPSN